MASVKRSPEHDSDEDVPKKAKLDTNGANGDSEDNGISIVSNEMCLSFVNRKEMSPVNDANQIYPYTLIYVCTQFHMQPLSVF